MSQKAKRVKITAAELKAKKADPKFVEMTNELLDSGVLSDDDGAIVKYARKRIYADRKADKKAAAKTAPKEKSYAWAAEHRKVQMAPKRRKVRVKSTNAYDDSTSALAAFKKRGTERRAERRRAEPVKPKFGLSGSTSSVVKESVFGTKIDVEAMTADMAANWMDLGGTISFPPSN